MAGSAHVVTGFPGFIGRRVVARLLEDEPDVRIVAIVQEQMLGAARDCAAKLGPDRIDLVVGDIGERRLGLGDEAYGRLTAETRRVYHLAAIYDLSVPLAVAQRVNVDGTGNVLDLCRDADALERHVYISTAFVAGLRTGKAYEHELVMGQGFKNHYEATKFQAEVWVRETMDRIPTTILRPAIVVGDSRTGETEKFDGPYYLLRAIAKAHGLGRALPQFGRAEATFNVVPVDYVVDAIVAAGADERTHGETLHLVDPDPLSSHDLVRRLSLEYAGREPRGSVPPQLIERSLRVGPIREAFAGTPPESIAYLNHPVTFDARRTFDLLTPHDLRPPTFTDYAGPMVSYFKRHEHDPDHRPKGHQ